MSLRTNTATPSSRDSSERDGPLRPETSPLTDYLTPETLVLAMICLVFAHNQRRCACCDMYIAGTCRGHSNPPAQGPPTAGLQGCTPPGWRVSRPGSTAVFWAWRVYRVTLPGDWVPAVSAPDSADPGHAVRAPEIRPQGHSGPDGAHGRCRLLRATERHDQRVGARRRGCLPRVGCPALKAKAEKEWAAASDQERAAWAGKACMHREFSEAAGRYLGWVDQWTTLGTPLT